MEHRGDRGTLLTYLTNSAFNSIEFRLARKLAPTQKRWIADTRAFGIVVKTWLYGGPGHPPQPSNPPLPHFALRLHAPAAAPLPAQDIRQPLGPVLHRLVGVVPGIEQAGGIFPADPPVAASPSNWPVAASGPHLLADTRLPKNGAPARHLMPPDGHAPLCRL